MGAGRAIPSQTALHPWFIPTAADPDDEGGVFGPRMHNVCIAALLPASYTNPMKRCLSPVLAFMVSCSVAPGSRSDGGRYFQTEVKPVLQQQCLRCHDGTRPPPALNLSSRAAAFEHRAGGRRFIVPGDPDHSLLITAVERGGTHARKMPHADLSLTDDQIGILREWVGDGAFWPEGRAGTLHPESSAETPR